MADIAELGFAANSSQLKEAKADLQAIVPAADGAGKAADNAAISFEKLDAAADKLTAAASGLMGAADKLDSVLERFTSSALGASNAATSMGAATGGAVTGVQALGAAVTGINSNLGDFSSHVDTFRASMAGIATTTTGVNAALGDFSSHVDMFRSQIASAGAAVTGVNANLGDFSAHMDARKEHMAAGWDEFTKGANNARKAINFTAQDSLNASRQLSDIGVTAAMGMSPFMIAIQQGPQLLDILQNKAALTGQTLGAVFRAAAAAIWSALAPLLPWIAGIAVVIGVVAGAFALGARNINKSNGDMAKQMDLTEKQLKKLKKAGVETSVTIGDTFKAFFEVAGERLAEAFKGPTKSLTKAWDATMKWLTTAGLNTVKAIVGLFAGLYSGIKASWSLLPAAIGDAMISGINISILGAEKLLNTIIGGINWLREKAGLDKMATVSLARVPNMFAGKAVQAGQAFSKGFSEGFNGASGAVDRFFADVSKKAIANRKKIIKDALGDVKTPKAKKGPKTDAAKFADIVNVGENDISKERARAQAASFELSAQGAAALEERTKLLNDANTKNIKLTDAMRKKIDELAFAYGNAKVAADNAIALREVLKASDADIANLDTQIAQIGKYGRELAYASEMAKLLAEARSKKMTPEAINAAMPQLQQQANKFADKKAMADSLAFIEQQRQAGVESARSMEMQRAEIGMTANQVTLYEGEQRLLNDALRQHIELTPDEITALRQMGREQALVEISIRKTRDALEFAKDSTKGFVTDMLSGLRQGKSAWETFGNSVLNVLNKIADKLVGGWIDQLFAPKGGAGGGGGLGGLFSSIASGIGSLFGGGKGDWASGVGGVDISGGIFNAKGNAFDGSGIVDRTTPFAFGKGGANLGIMGEAGPEAIVPLKRGPNGSLGVQMYGAGGQGGKQAPVAVNVAIEETENFRAYVKETAQG